MHCHRLSLNCGQRGSFLRGALLTMTLTASLWLGCAPAGASEASAELVRQHLYLGTLAAGEAELAAKVAADAGDREARFGLGLLRFTRAVEHLGQSLYRYGLTPPRTFSIPILRFPVPPNPRPETITYRALRDVLKAFDDDLAAADTTLQGLGDGEVTVVLDLARIRLDLRGDGKPTDDETLAFILTSLSQRPGAQVAPLGSLEVKFDAGDAPWFAGYSHVLMGLCDFLLAHDFQSTFDAGSHLFFAKSGAPAAAALSRPLPAGSVGLGFPDTAVFADLIALIHTLEWPVVEPDRMGSARQHLKAMIALSRKSWTLILAETGDDREWLPNPRQTHVALGQRVRQEQIDAWMAALDEAEAILDGRVLVPHWRFARGIDLKRFFEAPQTFDLVMFVTGAGAVPYLGDGPITSAQRWTEITRAFEDNFLGYALWFN
ncbi:MAG: hypothetical protein ACHQAY_21825 [Hyphomicrobiales bacterium]